MPNVPSPISNEMDQSPQGLLGMASGRSTSKETLKEASDELRRTSKAEKRFGDFSDAVVNAVKLGTMDRETAERFLLGNTELFLDASRNKEFTPYYGRDVPRAFRTKEGLRDIIKKSRNEMQQEQLGLAGGGLVSLQQGRSTDVAGNIARSLSPQEELEQYGKVLTAEERLILAENEKEILEKRTALKKGLVDTFANLQGDIEGRRLEQQLRIEDARKKSKLPKILRNDLNTDSVTSDDLQAQMEQQLLRESTETGTQGNVGLVEGANISNPTTTPEVKPKTSVIEQIFDTSQQLGLPKVEIPRMTEEEKQRELGAYTLGTLSKAFGTAKNLGEAGAILGEGAMGLSAIKRKQREDDIKVLSADRTQSVEDITLANTLLKTQLLQEQYAKQGDSNRVKSLEILQEEIKRLQDSIPDEDTQKRIAKLSAQLDAELNKMFGAEALPMFQGM